MNAELRDLQERFSNLRIWSQRGQRAPYKPLALISAIAGCLKAELRMMPFISVEERLRDMVRLFGPHRAVISRNGQYPFYFLQNDGVWELDRPHLVDLGSNGRHPTRESLLQNNIHGGLLATDYYLLKENPEVALNIAHALIDAHFAPSLHEDILSTAGFYDAATEISILSDVTDYGMARYRKRHSAFRSEVMDAYHSRCAVCEFAVRVADSPPIAIEAAHIRWHAADGPASVQNGIALCALHHSLFDYGAFTLLDNLIVFVSSQAIGSGVTNSLRQYHGESIRVIPDRVRRPSPHFWRGTGKKCFGRLQTYRNKVVRRVLICR